MQLSATDLIHAKEAARNLLEALGLRNYLYQVEPRENPWMVRVDCAVEDGWRSMTVDVDVTDLLESRNDDSVFERLLASWSKHFQPCLPD